jgi:hypothetical protein
MAKDLWYDEYEDTYTRYSPTTSKKGGWKSKYGGNSWSKSWSSFSFVVDYEDNDNDLFVKSPSNYVTPSAKEIKNKVKVNKQTSIDTIKELARICYFKMIEEKEYISERFSDYENLSDSDKSDYNTKKEFFDKIYEQYIPGFSPLDQAIAIYLKMKNEKVDEYGDKIESDDLDLTNTLDFDRAIYNDPTINEQLELNDLSKNRKMEILNVLSLVGEFGGEFKVEKEIETKIVANSDEYFKMIMRDYSQFHMIDLYQKMFPNFRSKFLTKDLTVNVPVDKKEQIQKIIIILDFSGSMCEDEKQIWVNAILIDRFKYVIKGEAEVLFSYFVDSTEDLEFQHIKTREDVINFWKTFSNNPNGGTTEVGDMVEYIANEIAYKKLCNLKIDLSEEKPEILVINDGEDSINIDKFPYKVNAITLRNFNEELKDLCIETEGKLIEVNYEGEVYAHDKLSVTKIK